MRRIASQILAILLLSAIVAFFAYRFPNLEKGTDFPAFYAAARMVLERHGSQLYDVAAQDRFLARDSGRTGIYFFHPPFEALIYLPFAVFSLPTAYALWCALNGVLLVVAARSLSASMTFAWDWTILVPASLLFVPLLLNFFQGQDSLLLLCLVALAVEALQGNRCFAAGALLGCGMFKFHLVLPLAVLLLILGRRRFLTGFVLVVIGLGLLSTAISGWPWLDSYFLFLTQLTNIPLVGIHSQQMANLRGLFGSLLPGRAGLALTLALASSAIVFCAALYGTARVANSLGGVRLASANAVLASILVGYHLSPHDLTILVIPLAFLTEHLVAGNGIGKLNKILLATTLATLFLPPLHVLLLARHVYTYACFPLLLLFGLVLLEMGRNSATRERVSRMAAI
jgi:hypothetical protein